MYITNFNFYKSFNDFLFLNSLKIVFSSFIIYSFFTSKLKTSSGFNNWVCRSKTVVFQILKAKKFYKTKMLIEW